MLCMYVTVCVKYANKFNEKKKKTYDKLSTICRTIELEGAWVYS